MSLVAQDPGTVTVWSDIGCPWASLALHTLRAAARERGQPLVIDHRAFPLELLNRQPTPKHIVEPEAVVIGGHRPELGWRVWAGAEADYPSSTLFALEAVQAAKDPALGGLRASDELDAALRRAFYVESRCVSVPSVVLDAADTCPGLDAPGLRQAMERGAGRPEVFAQWHLAEGDEVRGSPHLFTADGWEEHNPGASFGWSGSPRRGGLPHLDGYDPSWAGRLLDRLAEAPPG